MSFHRRSIINHLAVLAVGMVTVLVILYGSCFGILMGVWLNKRHWHFCDPTPAIPWIFAPGVFAAQHSSWLEGIYDRQLLYVLR